MVRMALPMILAAAILLIDAPWLVRRRLWGELATHIVLTAAATVTLLLVGQEVALPSLITWLRELVMPIGEMVVGPSSRP